MSHSVSSERTERIDPSSREHQTRLTNAEVRPTKDEHGRPTEIYPGYNANLNNLHTKNKEILDEHHKKEEELRNANANTTGEASNGGTSSGGIHREKSPFWDPVVDSVDRNKKE